MQPLTPCQTLHEPMPQCHGSDAWSAPPPQHDASYFSPWARWLCQHATHWRCSTEEPSDARPWWCHAGRAQAAARLLAQQHVPVDAPRVLDLGAGCQDLGRYLVPGATYIASDLEHPPAAAQAASLRCDFNRGQFPRVGRADVVAALGVVEYMCQPAAFLRCAPTQPQEWMK